MKIDQHAKNISKSCMHAFLLMAVYLLGDMQRPFVSTAPPGGKVFAIMILFILSLLFGAVAYLTELEE